MMRKILIGCLIGVCLTSSACAQPGGFGPGMDRDMRGPPGMGMDRGGDIGLGIATGMGLGLMMDSEEMRYREREHRRDYGGERYRYDNPYNRDYPPPPPPPPPPEYYYDQPRW